VISDWTAINETTGVESVKAGCDIEMPGPTKWRGPRVFEAIKNGQISPEEVKRAAANVLKLVQRTKGFNCSSAEASEQTDDNEALQQIIRTAGAEGIVLLKNENNILPIKQAKTIAIIGPNAKRCIAGGGGSAKVNPYYLISPFDGIKAATNAEMLYAQGCDTSKWLPLASKHCTTPTGEPGVTIEYYKGDKFIGEPFATQHKASTDLYLWDSAPKEVLPAYSFRVKTTLCPTTSGIHTFGFSSVGPGRLFLNEKLFIDNWDWTEEGEAMFGNSDDVLKSIHLEQNEPVEILVESTSEARPLSKIAKAGTHGYGGCRIGYQEEQTTDLLAEAVTIAKEADVAIIVVGLDNEWESEGYDRKTIALPKNGSQDALITAVLAANPNTIVVNQSGSPIAMPWADSAPAILQAWYQGQEAGNALADVLFGKASPSGKLPTTFPKRLEDCPAVGPERWGGVDGKVRYDEGVFVGYRHYEKNQVEPLWPFGHGLSYTNFVYGDARIDKTVLEEAEDGLTVSVVITNTGTVAGSDIVQAYVRDVEASLPRPEKELQAFAKVHIEPYQSETVRLRLDKYSVGFYDTKAGSWVAEKGDFEVLIGASSVDIRYVNLSDRMNVFVVSTNGRVIRCKVSFEVQKSFSWIL
jgi:beta-glucosidase